MLGKWHTDDNVECKCEYAEYIDNDYICKLTGKVCKVQSNKFECSYILYMSRNRA